MSEGTAQSGGPVGQGEYVVRQGDCLSSIALEHGFFWSSLWDLPENEALREARGDPNALLPGDKVTIPPLRQRGERSETGKRHRFKRKGEPSKLVLRMETPDGRPRANIKYTAVIEGKAQEGATDAEGMLTLRIPGNAREGVLHFDTDSEEPEEYDLDLGALDPVTSVTGVQARLLNLGYECGPVDGKSGERTRTALEDFQRANKLPITGEPDAATRDKLVELHGS